VIEFILVAFFLAPPPDAGTAASPPPAASASPSASSSQGRLSATAFKNPVQITADRLEVLGKKSQAVYSGRVKAVRGDTTISCGRLVAEYTRAQEITRIECVDGVEVTSGERWAKGERAVFDNIAGVLVVTGSPEARQGPNRMAGTKVTFNIDRDTIEVENARTIFEMQPNKKKPKTP
jgi:lipopolysaccharide export system protein LptA